MELSWDIRTLDGERTTCEAWRIDTVQLRCQEPKGASPCTGARLPTWECSDYGGATRFVIPDGLWKFSIDVRCGDGSPAAVRVPDPIVREIRTGEVAQLNALLIVVEQACP